MNGSICSPQDQQGFLDCNFGPDALGAGVVCQAELEEERLDALITLELKN